MSAASRLASMLFPRCEHIFVYRNLVR